MVAVEEEALSFPDEKGNLHRRTHEYTKLLTDLVNVDVAVILLNSLPEEEYETFTLTLINGRQSLNYNDVSATLVNYEGGRTECLLQVAQ